MSRFSFTFPALLAFAALGGCAADPDGDGLSNGEEKDLGLDKKAADTDGDGLKDGDEVAFGSNPKNPDTDGDLLGDAEEKANGADPHMEDTDGDGYLDYDEVQEGSLPDDPDSRIYTGNWPYNRDADALGKKAATGRPYGVGDKMFRMDSGKDQFGDDFDLNDFGGHGKKIIVDGSAVWCGPCNATAMWLSVGGEDPTMIDYFGDNDRNGVADIEDYYGGVRASVAAGDIYWVTFLTQNNVGDPTKVPDVREWDESYPNERIPVVTDPNSEMLMAVNSEYFPAFLVLDEKMRVIFRGDLDGMMQFVQQ